MLSKNYISVFQKSFFCKGRKTSKKQKNITKHQKSNKL